MTTLSRACLTHLASPAKSYSPETRATYERTYLQFVSFLTRDLRLRDDVVHFTTENVEAFHNVAMDRGLKATTIIKNLSALSTLARYAMRVRDEHGKRLLLADPTKGFEWPAAVPVDRPFLDPAQARAFFAVEVTPCESFVREFLFETGLRAGQSCRLNVGSLKDVEGGLFVATSLKGRGGLKRRKDLPLSPALARTTWDRLLARGISSLSDSAELPLLCNERGERYRRHDLYALTLRIGRRAGLPFRVGPHTLRHTMKYLLDMAGVAPATQSRLMTHDSPASIKAYQHFRPSDLVAARAQQREVANRYLGGHEPNPTCPHEIVSMIATPQGRQHVCAMCGQPFGIISAPKVSP